MSYKITTQQKMKSDNVYFQKLHSYLSDFLNNSKVRKFHLPDNLFFMVNTETMYLFGSDVNYLGIRNKGFEVLVTKSIQPLENLKSTTIEDVIGTEKEFHDTYYFKKNTTIEEVEKWFNDLKTN